MNQMNGVSDHSPASIPMSGFGGCCSGRGIAGHRRPISFSAHSPRPALPDFDTAQLDRFEALLDCTDPELFDWIIGGIAPPPQHDHDVLQAAARLLRPAGRTLAHNEN